MKVLVTGNQGFIGNVMEETLLTKGYDVVGLDAGYFEGKANSFVPTKDFVLENRKKNQIIKDVRDIARSDLEGVEAIVHLAALSNDPLGDLDESLTDDINFLSTVRLGSLAKAMGIERFVYSSSCSMYGAADTSKPLDETAEFNPVTAYARSKVDSERFLSDLADDNFSPTYMRNATAYGISPRMRFDLVVNSLAGWTHTTGKVRMTSDGKPWRPIVHIRDICSAFRSALEAPRKQVHNEAYNIGRNDENYQIIQIAEKVVEGFPGSELICEGKETDSRSYKIDFNKSKSLPGFNPEWTLERGIQELKETYEKVNLTEDEFNGMYFITLKRMKFLMDGKLDSNLRPREQRHIIGSM